MTKKNLPRRILMDIIKQIEREQMRTDIPAFKSGIP